MTKVQEPPETVSPLSREVGERLKHLREVVRKMSPEDVAARAADMKADENVSPSYIRRVEKGLNSPTLEKLDVILRALNSNLGLFFEYKIDESTDGSAKDRRYGRIVQRGLESTHREDVISTIRIIERGL